MPLKFEVDIQSQSKVRVRKPKNLIWPPGGHFESDRWKSIGFCLWPPSICIWNWNSKANLTYAPETMSSTDRRTDRRTDGRTRWIQYTPPPTSLGGGIIIEVHLTGQDWVTNELAKYISTGSVSGLVVWHHFNIRTNVDCFQLNPQRTCYSLTQRD